jgi:CubicO group peptidase (beta-lactamase class C family)
VPEAFAAAARVLADALAARAFPCATAEVGGARGVVWRFAGGRLTYEPDAPAASVETVFDLASLTKVIATTSMAMRLVDAGRLGLDDPVARHLAEWRGRDREMVTVRDLLAHASGLTAYAQLYEKYSSRAEFQTEICAMALEYPPRTQATYSDLGFMLLGFILEDVGGLPLDRLFASVAALAGGDPLTFNPPRAWRDRTAPTGDERWRHRTLVGEAHDENAAVLGGVAAHAGVFGTAKAVGAFARLVLRAFGGEAALAQPETVRTFARRTNIPGSSRALGWDTMLPTSSCGRLMSPGAIGHTGFTGTSLWIDHERDVYAVLLTNRVYPDRSNEAILSVRRAFHDAVMAACA